MSETLTITEALSAARKQVRDLARAIGMPERDIREAIEAHASIERAPHRVMERAPAVAPAGMLTRLTAVPKGPMMVRSQSLREAYRLIPCQHCGADDGTVCCAHSNWAVHGKAGARKAHDNRGASLCYTCHSRLDQGGDMTEPEKQAMWWAAHVLTIRALVTGGHWPRHIKVPDMSRSPF